MLPGSLIPECNHSATPSNAIKYNTLGRPLPEVANDRNRDLLLF